MKKTKDSMVGPSDGVQVMITDRGSIVTGDILKQYEVEGKSKQMEMEGAWKAGSVIEPPYSLAKLMNFLDTNTIHSSCVRTKVQDSVGKGYFIEPEEEELAEGEESEVEEGEDANYKILNSFFNRVNDKENLKTVLRKVMIDYEACGNGYIEVSRGVDGKINGLYHVNAVTIRWAKNKDMLVQQVGIKYIYFKQFGDERILDRFTGKFVASLSDIDRIANEIIPIVQYSYKSSVYGVPEWLPSIFSMYADEKEREYNLTFFDNYGVPAYAMIVNGGNLTPDVQREVNQYFETKLKGSNHKTLTLSTPKNVQITFERLSVEQKDSSFRFYKADNRQDVLTAHHVPPYRMGIAAEGALGGTSADTMDRIYLDSVVAPRQEQIEWIVNELIIKQGFEIQGWLLRFNNVDIGNEDLESQIFTRYFNMGVMTANEIREELGLEKYEGGDVFYLSGSMVPAVTPPMNPDEENIDAQPEGVTEEQKRGIVPLDMP